MNTEGATGTISLASIAASVFVDPASAEMTFGSRDAPGAPEARRPARLMPASPMRYRDASITTEDVMRAGRLTIATLLAAMAPVAPATASQVAGAWFMGDWQCTLDGRATRMTWRNVSVDHGSSHGDVGTSVAGVERRGRFLDRGAWSDLTFGRATSTTLNFRHADGNGWFLRRISATQARGNSTWNGRPYPLSCTKTR